MLKSALIVLALISLAPYACSPVYRFDTARPFSGDRLYNPYASVAANRPWRRVQLHTHSRAWLGLTAGKQTDTAVVDAYRNAGYDVASLSNYQRITATQPDALRVYEHGYNVGKHHQLAIGARSVMWFDLPLWQSVHHKQYMIDRLAQTADLVAIAHPNALQGYAYPDQELAQLTGYQLIEVVNGRFTDESGWDAALSAGRPVWGIGNDDTHDIRNRDRFDIAWNMTAADSNKSADVINALRMGRSYATVRTAPNQSGAVLSRVVESGGVVTVDLDRPATRIAFIGQNGAIKKTMSGLSSASYAFAPDDSYIRAVVEVPGQTLYLNPVIRFDGTLPSPGAPLDLVWTWIVRGGILFVCARLTFSLIRRHASSGLRTPGQSRPWRRVAALVITMFVLTGPFACQVNAQEQDTPLPTTFVAKTTLGSSFDAGLLAALPLGDNVFSVLETMQAEVIASRVSTGGVGFGSAPHLSAFGSSITQTRFRVGDVDITDPSSGAVPLLLPELFLWNSVSAATGLSSDFLTPGVGVTLEPRTAGAGPWSVPIEASTSFGDTLTAMPATLAPAIARATGWNRASVSAAGPFASGRARAFLAAAWTGVSESDRGAPLSRDSNVASVFANLTATPSALDDVRAIAWVQRVTFPAATTMLFVTPNPEQQDTAVHFQSSWSHGAKSDSPWRAFAGYTQRDRSPQAILSQSATIERLLNGPPAQVTADTGARTARRLDAGVHASRRLGKHALDFGADLDLANASSSPGFSGRVGELVDGVPSRLWQYTAPPAVSRRGSTTLGAFGRDRFQIAEHATLDVSIRFEGLFASAEGASQGIGWSTFMPQAEYRAWLTPNGAVEWFVGGGITPHQLPLDALAWGDPSTASVDISRWTVGPVETALDAPLLVVGANVGRIDPNLSRPTSNDLVFGIEASPRTGVVLRLEALCRWERDLLGIVNQSSAEPKYTIVNVHDPGYDLEHSTDDEVLSVFSLVPSDLPSRFDNVLTNPAGRTATRLGTKLTLEVRTNRLFLLFGATAYAAEGAASNRGFLEIENDQGVIGDASLDPNSAINPSGRLFGDRAFTGKVSTVYRLPSDVTVGAIARYQDGQPFARLLIVPDLVQGPDIVRATVNGGPRFTFTATLDLRVQKSFAAAGRDVSVFAEVYNLLNLAEEVEERTVTGAQFRTPTAFQPPRAARIGARVAF